MAPAYATPRRRPSRPMQTGPRTTRRPYAALPASRPTCSRHLRHTPLTSQSERTRRLRRPVHAPHHAARLARSRPSLTSHWPTASASLNWPPPPAAAPPRKPGKPRLGLLLYISMYVEEVGSAAKRRTPLPPQAQAWRPHNTHEAGRRPVALNREPSNATPERNRFRFKPGPPRPPLNRPRGTDLVHLRVLLSRVAVAQTPARPLDRF
jgi:hypothetical protein